MTDTYDIQYPDTGSSNISKATPEWKEKLEQARAAYVPGMTVLHEAYKLVNQEVRDGKFIWDKCMNCGSPYRSYPGMREFCSDECTHEYTNEYLPGLL